MQNASYFQFVAENWETIVSNSPYEILSVSDAQNLVLKEWCKINPPKKVKAKAVTKKSRQVDSFDLQNPLFDKIKAEREGIVDKKKIEIGNTKDSTVKNVDKDYSALILPAKRKSYNPKFVTPVSNPKKMPRKTFPLCAKLVRDSAISGSTPPHSHHSESEAVTVSEPNIEAPTDTASKPYREAPNVTAPKPHSEVPPAVPAVTASKPHSEAHQFSTVKSPIESTAASLPTHRGKQPPFSPQKPPLLSLLPHLRVIHHQLVLLVTGKLYLGLLLLPKENPYLCLLPILNLALLATEKNHLVVPLLALWRTPSNVTNAKKCTFNPKATKTTNVTRI